MGVGAAGLYTYDVVEKSSRSLSHLLMSSCRVWVRVGGGPVPLSSARSSLLLFPLLSPIFSSPPVRSGHILYG